MNKFDILHLLKVSDGRHQIGPKPVEELLDLRHGVEHRKLARRRRRQRQHLQKQRRKPKGRGRKRDLNRAGGGPRWA